MGQGRSFSAAAIMAASTAAGKQRIPKVAKVGDVEEPQYNISDVGYQRFRAAISVPWSKKTGGRRDGTESCHSEVLVSRLPSLRSRVAKHRFGSVNSLLC